MRFWIFIFKGEPPAEVQIGLDNFEILKIDDREFTIEINAYFIVKWRDKRIEEINSPRQSSRNRYWICQAQKTGFMLYLVQLKDEWFPSLMTLNYECSAQKVFSSKPISFIHPFCSIYIGCEQINKSIYLNLVLQLKSDQGFIKVA